MGDKSKIEWLDGGATWNPIRARRKSDGKVGWFCTKPSPGCKNCYAERMNVQAGNNPGRMGNGARYAEDQRDKVELYLSEETLLQPLTWKKPRLIFPCSMTDWMADFVKDEWRDKMLAVMALTPQHTYLTLTKRAERQRAYLSWQERGYTIRGAAWTILGNPQFKKFAHHDVINRPWPLPNLWPGVSAEDQPNADKRIPELLQTMAAVRWVSAEPLLGSIDFQALEYPHPRLGPRITLGKLRGINWVVVGGESGPGARPMHPGWARSVRDQCQAAGVPFFFKQWGEYITVGQGFAAGDDFQDRLKDGYARVGKKAAGRLLDGREWNEYPEVRQ